MDSHVGKIVGTGVGRLDNLHSLRLSFILGHIKDEGLIDLLHGLQSLTNLKKLHLVLMANDLTGNSSQAIKQFL